MNSLKTSWNLEIKHSKNHYSEPVQEILGTIPSWITRWGVTIILGVFTMIIIGCCLIDYPQTLTAPITVTISEDGTITGEAMAPSLGFGKVQVGQKVNVRLDCYPYMEYGVLVGEVSSFQKISKPTIQGTISYPTKIAFLDDTLSHRVKIPLDQLMELSGTAKIMLQERKLIEVLIPQIVLFKQVNE